MSQLNPSNIFLAQAVHYLKRLRRDYALKQFKTEDEIAEVIEKALTNFENNAGKSMTQFEMIYKSEIPSSTKMNRFWSDIQTDINLLQQQIDLLRAAAVETHNFSKTDILKAKEDNLRSQNKIKTLQMYSNVDDASLVYFGDTFITEDLIDWDAMSDGQRRLMILGRQMVGLDIEEQESALESNPTITILDGSNGFLGNNQEILDPQSNSVNNSTDAVKQYFFRYDTYPSNELPDAIDELPSTWIEFEKYYVPQSDRATALEYNFNYKFTNDARWKYLRTFVQNNELLNWADGFGPDGLTGSLIFNFEVDLKNIQKSNLIKLLPFGLADNVNNPIKIRDVSVSLDKTIWYSLTPNNVWLANGIDRKLAEVNDENIVIGEGTWVTNGDPIRYVRFEIEQPRPITVNIGHHYYYDRTTNNATTANQRRLGPVPPLDDPGKYINANSSLNDLVQRTEYFVGKRWAIGIRDITVLNNVYRESGALVSRRFDVAGVVDRVSIDADIEIPDTYDQDYNWVKFYVSPDDGINWYQISRIQDDMLGIPEIIAFNDPTPQALREPGVAYYDVSKAVTSIRVKIVMERPSDDPYSSPILKPYTLKVKRRT